MRSVPPRGSGWVARLGRNRIPCARGPAFVICSVIRRIATNIHSVREESIVRRIWLLLACVLGVSALAGGVAVMRALKAEPAPATRPSTSDQQQADVMKAGVWQPPSGLKQIPIWPNGAPDMADVSQPPERVEVTKAPDLVAGRPWIKAHDVTSPTMTVFPPTGKNTGASMVVFPGGGFRLLAMDLEGTEICDWLTAKGMTCVLLKYRVPKSNHYWDKELHRHITPKVPRALQDAQRTIRLVRARAKELNLDPNKIGVIGFSAGGYLVAQTSNIFESTYKPVDEVDTLSSRPDFAVALYPGHLCRPESGNTLDPGIHVTKQTPPTFLLQAWDDPVDEICNSTVYARALDDAGVPAEVHLFAKGGHAFGLRRKEHPVAMWPSLVENWLKEIGILYEVSTTTR
jgi:acetyl esterase/lipase